MMEEVVTVDMCGQRLKCLPDDVRHRKVLHRLDVSRNQLGGITKDCAFLDSIEWLDLSHNAFPGIPMKVVFMSNLRVLHITHNPLRRIPSWISELKHLRDLRLPIIEAETLVYIRNDDDCRSVVGGVRRARSIHMDSYPREEEEEVDTRPLLTLPDLVHLVFTLERYDPTESASNTSVTCTTHYVFSYSGATEIARAIQEESYNRIYYHKDASPFFALPLKAPSKVKKEKHRKRKLRILGVRK